MDVRIGLRAFTLIELLIVVAIIGILAAIAVPNFMNARVRANVARVEADFRSLATAFESYRLDTNDYPPIFPPTLMADRYIPLTTPVSYMSSIPKDPFVSGSQTPGTYDSNNLQGDYDYWTRKAAGNNGPLDWGRVTAFPAGRYLWQLRSLGPRKIWEAELIYTSGPKAGEYISYNPSNGIVSRGNIIRYGP
ncbi:MAG: prepilin-type N-terminal cleavage/methylation domain-containing protein [bacterium]